MISQTAEMSSVREPIEQCVGWYKAEYPVSMYTVCGPYVQMKKYAREMNPYFIVQGIIFIQNDRMVQ